MAAPEAFSTQSSVTHRLSSAPLPSQSPDIILHSHNNSLSLSHQTHTRSICTMCHRHRVRVAQKHTHIVSPQCSLINEMVCSLPQAWTNQARGHKSLPAGNAEGHWPLFIGNLSPDYPDRESNTLVTGRHRHHVFHCVFFLSSSWILLREINKLANIME